jgi:SPX domain protein involved in polyphosphate accumulation
MTLKTALLYERYELKYHIPLALVAEISDYISGFCEMDHYSKISPDNFYSINNLYLDTPHYQFFQNALVGQDGRFNMRVRTYGDEENPLYFLEIKKKTGGFVKKTRAKISTTDWFDALENNLILPAKDELVKKDYAYDFAYQAIINQARPVVFTQYRRKAYFSTIDDYARVTFDRDMRFVPRDTYTFDRSKEMQFYDNPNYFEPETNVILELKCETRVPYWIIDLIRTFNLQRSGFSKFVYAVNELNSTKLGVSQHSLRMSAI